jgi:hydroxymethylpyrimidine/phosphomethylpyrimidine kinase
VKRIEEMQEAARRIHDLGPRCVVVKGGHREGRPVDLLFDGQDFQTFDTPRLKQRNTHGTGCTFSAALATILAEKLPIRHYRECKKFRIWSMTKAMWAKNP